MDSRDSVERTTDTDITLFSGKKSALLGNYEAMLVISYKKILHISSDQKTIQSSFPTLILYILPQKVTIYRIFPNFISIEKHLIFRPTHIQEDDGRNTQQSPSFLDCTSDRGLRDPPC